MARLVPPLESGGCLRFTELIREGLDLTVIREVLDGDAAGSLRSSVERVSARWRAHEDTLTGSLLAALRDRDDLRLLGPTTIDIGVGRHRCPTVAFAPRAVEPLDVARRLAHRGVQAGAGHFYAWRVLEGMDIDPRRGVVRLSAVHYTSADDVARVLDVLDDVLI